MTRVATPTHEGKLRCGYSLLELMIALVLLVGLLAAGWSMLATYRDAEQRGWRLVERTQAVRVAHSWLQNDLMHVAQTSTEQLLVGNSLGFTATIVPSIDPVPFFERMLAGPQDASLRRSSGDLSLLNSGPTTDDLLDEKFEKPLWPLENLQVEYELVQSSEASVGAQVVPIYDLVRRERVDRDQLQQAQQDTQQQDSRQQDSRQSNERVLTINDLYRQSDTMSRADQALLQENQLPGLTNAEFWYCDGVQWKRSWNRAGGQLPTAVALVFDFAPRAKQALVRTTMTDFSASPADSLNRQGSFDLESIGIDEPSLESSTDSFELVERDVRLVVLLEQRFQTANSPSPARGSRVTP